MRRALWPVAEAAQADYELLRSAKLGGGHAPDARVVERFARGGLPGLIERPAAEASYLATLIGAARPAWCGRNDPRDLKLRDVYAFLLDETSALAGLGVLT